MISPTQRSLAHLRRRGALSAIVERWNPHAKVRQDLWRFGDVLAVVPDGAGNLSFLIVQACRTDDQAARVAKIRSERVWPNARRWLEAGGKIEVWGWAVRGAQGTRKRWTLRTISVGLEGEEEIG